MGRAGLGFRARDVGADGGPAVTAGGQVESIGGFEDASLGGSLDEFDIGGLREGGSTTRAVTHDGHSAGAPQNPGGVGSVELRNRCRLQRSC